MITDFPFDSMDALRRDLDDPTIDRDELRARLAVMGLRETRRSAQPEVAALMAAGWELVIPESCIDPEPFQWFWRRPGKRAGRPGRLFKSTSQAYNALMRETDGTISEHVETSDGR